MARVHTSKSKVLGNILGYFNQFGWAFSDIGAQKLPNLEVFGRSHSEEVRMDPLRQRDHPKIFGNFWPCDA